jgi:hypothetical protein
MSETVPNGPEVLEIENQEALRDLLEAHGFDTSKWGVGATKSVDSLWEEIDQGETGILRRGTELIRRTHVAAVDVAVSLGSGKRYQLRESKQVYEGGWVRERNLVTSLAEKIKPDEDTEVAVRRALAEELGISEVKSVELLGEQVIHKTSATFSGIETQLMLRFAKVELHEKDFKVEGYVERQPEKSIYFAWELIGD